MSSSAIVTSLLIITWIYRRLKEFKDTVKLIIFTLDFVTQNYGPIIRTVEGLPHDCLFLLPCAMSVSGVVIVTCNSIK
jgi:cleavage and polyadenylation specificity factor subunit 1